MRVLVLHNAVAATAPPDEQDVLVQAEAIGVALAQGGHQVRTLGCDLDLPHLMRSLTEDRPEAVFNLVESLGGQGRLIHVVPGLLDSLGLPYTGCPAEALFITSHKVLAKQWLRSAGWPTPSWVQLAGDRIMAREDGTGPAGSCVVKSVWEDASLGMDDGAVVPADESSLRQALGARQDQVGAPWFAERYVEGREFNLSLLDGPDGPQVLPPAEMVFLDYPPGKPRIVGYAAKWEADSFEYGHTVRRFDCPARDAALLENLKSLALVCWDLFDLRGWARVDFRVDEQGRPWILEVNANPCLSPDAGFAAAVERAGLSYQTAIGRILRAAAAGRGSIGV